MNRPRKKFETFEAYRINQDIEERRIKGYLKGRVIWSSSFIAEDPKDKLVLKKYRHMGTYRKSVHGKIGGEDANPNS